MEVPDGLLLMSMRYLSLEAPSTLSLVSSNALFLAVVTNIL